MTTELGTGRILLLDNEINQDTGTLKIKSTFRNPDGKLWPGQSVSLRILQKQVPDALTVPTAALQRGPDGYFLYIPIVQASSRDLALRVHFAMAVFYAPLNWADQLLFDAPSPWTQNLMQGLGG